MNPKKGIESEALLRITLMYLIGNPKKGIERQSTQKASFGFTGLNPKKGIEIFNFPRCEYIYIIRESQEGN
ncbi:MAG TPA: hypothetical protein VKU94_06675 [Geobacterales bacterium]|nr:hypothetical protein [Geobacterales bacterium]